MVLQVKGEVLSIWDGELEALKANDTRLEQRQPLQTAKGGSQSGTKLPGRPGRVVMVHEHVQLARMQPQAPHPPPDGEEVQVCLHQMDAMTQRWVTESQPPLKNDVILQSRVF